MEIQCIEVMEYYKMRGFFHPFTDDFNYIIINVYLEKYDD